MHKRPWVFKILKCLLSTQYLSPFDYWYGNALCALRARDAKRRAAYIYTPVSARGKIYYVNISVCELAAKYVSAPVHIHAYRFLKRDETEVV